MDVVLSHIQLYLEKDGLQGQKGSDKIMEDIQSPEAGPILLEIICSVNEQETEEFSRIIIVACGVIKSWTNLHWKKIPPDQKEFFYDKLKQSIFNCHPQSIYIAAVYTYMAQRTRDDVSYQQIVFDAFNKLTSLQSEDSQIAALEVIQFVCHQYQRKRQFELCEPFFLLQRTQDVTFPFYHQLELVSTEFGCKILIMSLNCFIYLIRRYSNEKTDQKKDANYEKTVIEMTSTPIEFSYQLIEFVINGNQIALSHLLGTCVRLLNTVMIKFDYLFESTIGNYIETLAHLLSFMNANYTNEISIISKILAGLYTFIKVLPMDTDLFLCFIESTKLAEADKAEFYENPASYFENIFSTHNSISMHPRTTARELVRAMIEADESGELAKVLITTLPSENGNRCLAHSIQQFDDLGAIDDVMSYFNSAFTQEAIDPIELVTLLELLRKLIPYIDVDLPEYMKLIPKFLKSEHAMVKIVACRVFIRLLKQDIYPEDNIAEILISFMEEFPTLHATKAINILSKRFPYLVAQQVDVVMYSIIYGINSQLELVDDDDEDVAEKAETYITNNIGLMTSLFKVSAQNLVIPALVEFLKTELGREDGIFLDYIADLITAIVLANNSVDVTLSILYEALNANETVIGFFNSFTYCFMACISNNPELFKQLQLGSSLVQISFALIHDALTEGKSYEQDKIFETTRLISWILQIEPVDIQEHLPMIYEVLDPSQSSPDVVVGMIQIILSMYYSKPAIPEIGFIEFVLHIQQDNWFYPLETKYLVALLYTIWTNLNTDLADLLVFPAIQLMREAIIQIEETAKGNSNIGKIADEEGVPDCLLIIIPPKFPSPIESIDIKPLIQNCFGFCSKEKMQEIENYMNQFNVQL